MELKIATPDDVLELTEFLLDFFEESVYSQLYCLNLDKGSAALGRLVSSTDADILWVPSVGAIGLGMAGNWFSDEVFAVEHFWYVHPDHRESKAGLFLLRCAEEWAKGMGANKLHMSTNRHTHPGVSEFLEQDGYIEVETSVVKEF